MAIIPLFGYSFLRCLVAHPARPMFRLSLPKGLLYTWVWLKIWGLPNTAANSVGPLVPHFQSQSHSQPCFWKTELSHRDWLFFGFLQVQNQVRASFPGRREQFPLCQTGTRELIAQLVLRSGRTWCLESWKIRIAHGHQKGSMIKYDRFRRGMETLGIIKLFLVHRRT
jgi:hypothetical protein